MRHTVYHITLKDTYLFAFGWLFIADFLDLFFAFFLFKKIKVSIYVIKQGSLYILYHRI